MYSLETHRGLNIQNIFCCKPEYNMKMKIAVDENTATIKNNKKIYSRIY